MKPRVNSNYLIKKPEVDVIIKKRDQPQDGFMIVSYICLSSETIHIP